MSSSGSLAPLRLKKREERRVREGHPWVFSNEVDTAETPLTAFAPGEPIQIVDYRDRLLGSGYVNPRSLICARLISRHAGVRLDTGLLIHRIKLALALRERLRDQPYYRLVFGEADALPGLIIDRYGEVLVVQITTAGMERVKDDLLMALRTVVNPRAILLRNDTPIRALEGLPSYVDSAYGTVPETVQIEEQGTDFLAPLGEGQKTGWFFDQRDNRLSLGGLSRRARVLDVFSYVGGFGIQAACAGAVEVVCVEESQTAIGYIERNADLNGVGGKVKALRGEAFETLKALGATGERFDIVILDPPAFVKRKKDLEQGVKAYRHLNELAMKLLVPDGTLMSCSCSYHLPQDVLVHHVAGAARASGRMAQVLDIGRQSADHPSHPLIPETAYLKVVTARVLDLDSASN